MAVVVVIRKRLPDEKMVLEQMQKSSANGSQRRRLALVRIARAVLCNTARQIKKAAGVSDERTASGLSQRLSPAEPDAAQQRQQ